MKTKPAPLHTTLVLYSAGLDSSVVLAMEIADKRNRDVLAISYDYGQTNSLELEKAKKLALWWGFRHRVVPIDIQVRDPRDEIPARNTLFLAKALEIALREKCDRVVYGAAPDSHYCDTSNAYIAAMAKVFALHGVTLEAPLKKFKDKKQVFQTALELGVPLKLIHSSRTNAVCGACLTSSTYLVLKREFERYSDDVSGEARTRWEIRQELSDIPRPRYLMAAVEPVDDDVDTELTSLGYTVSEKGLSISLCDLHNEDHRY